MFNALSSLAMAIGVFLGAVTFGISALVGIIVKAIVYFTQKMFLEFGARASIRKAITNEENRITLTFDPSQTQALNKYTDTQIGMKFTTLSSKKNIFARTGSRIASGASKAWGGAKSGASYVGSGIKGAAMSAGSSIKGLFTSKDSGAEPATS
jgi:hypothetical protein